MSAILKLALCPAPFQSKKNKDDKKKKKKRTCPEPPMQHVIMTADAFIPPFTDNGMSLNGGVCCNSSRFQPRQSTASSPRSSTSSNGNSHHHHHHQPQAACDNWSVSGRGAHFNNGYHQSGYVTDGGEGAFEAQLLQRATKERPANLRMTAVRDYAPCCNEELAVRKGQRVRVMYRNHDWVFAVTKHGQSGFLPFSYVRPSRKYSGYQSEPEIARIDDQYASGYDTDVPCRPYHPQRYPQSSRTYSINTACARTGSGSPIQARVDFDSGYLSAFESSSSGNYQPRRSPPSYSYRPTTVKPLVDSFDRYYIEELVVIHDFEAHEEDEVLVLKGDRVQVLNADDPNWLWVATLRTRREGFIPRSCCTLGNHPALSTQVTSRSSSQSRHRHNHHNNAHRHLKTQARDRFRQLAFDRSTNNNPTKMDKETIKKVGTKLIVLMDYEATCEDELTLEFSESVIADIMTQTGSEKIWVYCPRTDKCGYVPMSMVVPPVV